MSKYSALVLGPVVVIAIIGTSLAIAGTRPQGVPPMQSAAFNDTGEMMKLLGIKTLRSGANPNNPETNDEALAGKYLSTTPKLLQFNDGKPVKTAADWPKRRAELVEIFEREIYGRVPKRTPKITWKVTGITPGMSGSIPTVTKNLIGHVGNRDYPSVTVDIQASYTVPANTKMPVPIVMEYSFGFGGMARPGVTPWTQQAIENGWGYGTIIPTSIQPDSNRVDLGIIGLCNKGKPRKPDDWGALRAWGWGLSKVIDYFEKDKSAMVDPKKVAIEGVSRYGKAALIAAAFDERVAVPFVASSGAGGAKLFRHQIGELLENLAGGATYWIAGNIVKYSASDPLKTVADLPVDSHELISLVAPRPCLISYGIPAKGDPLWVDARGSYMAGILAGESYRLLGKTDFGVRESYVTAAMPKVNQLIGGELAWRQHDGGHEATPNWPTFFSWVSKYVPAPPLPTDKTPMKTQAYVPSSRTDGNSLIAHSQMVQKARKGGIDLYFLGDSITRRWGASDEAWKDNLANWKANFFGWNAGNFGWGADSTQNILWRISNGELDGVNPKVIVILAGTNNIGGGNSPTDVARGIKAIVDVCREKAPRAKIVLTGIFPRNDNMAFVPKIKETNLMLAKLTGKDLRFLDISEFLSDKDGVLGEGLTIDKLHLSTRGYQIWADHLKPILTELMGPPANSDHAPAPTGDPSQTPPRRPGGQ